MVIKVYTDGACSNNGKKNAKAGIGVYFSPDDERNYSGRIKGKQTNNVAEIEALIKAYKILKKEIENGEKVVFYSDSMYAIRAAGEYGKKNDEKGWEKEIPNKKLVKKIFSLFQGKKNIEIKYIKAHMGKKNQDSLGNECADFLAVKSLDA
jgi:ribonuclease HI